MTVIALRRDKHGASVAKQLVYLGEANPECSTSYNI